MDDEYGLEYNIYERVGMDTDVLGELGIKRDDPMFRDPTQRFYIFVDAVARQLKQRGIISISEGDIRHMLNKISDLELPKYKNPTGYVLGYYIGHKGVIDKRRFDAIKGRLSGLEYPLTPEALIRYGRLWVTQLV